MQRFKREPDTEGEPGEVCFYCAGEFSEGRFPCPTACQVSLCSLECMWRHRNMQCKRKAYPVPKFGERFSGSEAPLTTEVAKVGL